MPLLDYICPNCNKTFSELVKSSEVVVVCPDCKTVAKRNYNGQIIGSIGKTSKKCSGNCKTCSGCK